MGFEDGMPINFLMVNDCRRDVLNSERGATTRRRVNDISTHSTPRPPRSNGFVLGGAGKTQIALRFIQESSQLSETFMVDASTTDTIDTGLKNIAAAKNAGNTREGALKWLAAAVAP
ncbi:hypothetical protein DFH07DRAFT_1014508 [Mycena maculata]|uniref:Uncharacterized protein n=1 Tax=Mycena maculata TaxID=230809 RepID=A0AAD7JLP9_9AGAR|nr:hypothetical protein DFH07DRAFT_1014508 [Mycena maculata]